ncbi:extracellular solute-binding protein [Streptomyces omiyaensis]|uniref:Extracellular solute-binding protein n=1 Tax=Streptomyces omiyaensis TaxID=68247 RepID=A0ABW7BQT1_9ACTN|nr:extracellular solute-binding protein [Streptomyces omiyaensis]GGY41613.1 solute-binding protein [Streptomyces omiyaensis]
MRPRLFGATACAAAAGLLGSLLTACGSSAGSDGTTLRLVAAEYGTGPATGSQAYWDKLTAAFAAAHPGKKVEVTLYPWDDVDREVTRLVEEGNAPDVALMGAYSDFAAQGRLYSADELLSVRAEANFLPPLAEAGSFDNALYGLPFVASSRLLFYNEELFEKAGAEPPRTWADLKEAAGKLKKEGVPYPYALPLGPEEAHAEALIWLLSNGGGYAGSYGGYSIASEQNTRTFRWIRDNLTTPGLTGPVPPGELNRRDAFAAFLRGQVGMLNGYPSLLHEARAKGIKVGTLSMPVSGTLEDGQVPPAAGVADWMMAFKRDGNRELVGSFLEFVYEDENLNEFADRYHLLPSTVSANRASKGAAADPADTQFLDALRGAELYPVNEPSWLKVSDTIKRNIGKAVAPSADPQAVLGEIAHDVQEMAKQS